jgi:hypothetical protein
MLERKPPMLVIMALANKACPAKAGMARIACALMAKGGVYRSIMERR